jgi:hypothetical protein
MLRRILFANCNLNQNAELQGLEVSHAWNGFLLSWQITTGATSE